MMSVAALTSACGGPLSDEKPPLPSDESSPNANLAATGVLNAWSSATSEEYAPIACGAGNLITNMRCTGGYCDNVSIYCRSSAVSFGDVAFKPYFSEEGTNYQTCSSGYLMTGLVCRGGNCDDISIQCSRVTNRTIGTCRWADRTFSEEFPNTYDIPAGYYAGGLACTGSRCDNLRVYECPLL